VRPTAVIRGAGDLGTAVGRKLVLNGFRVVHLEIAEPLVVRRAVAFASAIFDGGTATVEGITARLAADPVEARAIMERGDVAVLVDPGATSLAALEPVVVVDAILAKRNTGTRREMAPFVVGLGPGFTAGVDVHAVVETCRGSDLGRVITDGAARPDTGIPGAIEGVTVERVLRAP
jgi:xanthine dehydrogenase accessory factor